MKYQSKAAWAQAKADEFERKARETEQSPPLPGPRGYAERARAVENLRSEEFRFAQMASSYRRRGI